MKNNIMKPVRSPLFYVGDKYKLMPQLSKLFPKNIDSFYDVFCGGGSVSLNVNANNFYLNDINHRVIELHTLLYENSKDMESFIQKTQNLAKKYGLSISELERNDEIERLKLEYKKTYFSKYNKKSYLKLRKDYNENQANVKRLYLLLVYGFNHMIRFNQSGLFNLPVGNVDWNSNVTKALTDYGEWASNNNIYLYSLDYVEFLENVHNSKNDFFYFDPPYLITFSEYNKLWCENEEAELLELLDDLDAKGYKWGLSNMIRHKGEENTLLKEWSSKYNIYEIDSNYISRFDNSVKKNSREVYITNVNSE